MKIMKVLKEYSPIILTILGSVGTVATSVLTARATVKAVRLLDERKNDKPESKIEQLKPFVMLYLPAFTVGVSSIACIFGANMLNQRQQASLTSAYALVSNSYQEYKRKLKELYGEETHQKICESLVVEKCAEVTITAESLIESCCLDFPDINEEKLLFYDFYGKRYFQSTISRVLQAEYHLNRNFMLRGHVSLNEFYEFLGLGGTESGKVVGWNCYEDIYWI
ncbi:MAG: DUF6353 family protein, partial [Lachnospiraceae bacterium]|nr:DUF6353 family protein [Lachnospiraceae bacterium]